MRAGCVSHHDLSALAAQLPEAWRSVVLAGIGTARLKLLRMDGAPYAEESHDCTEVLLVIDGVLRLTVAGQPVSVRGGELYLVQAGTPHAVAEGSTGTLLIVDT